jgi:hypothetical protein
MEKKIKTTNTDIEIRCTNFLAVDINSFRFMLDEEMPLWIPILHCTDGEKWEQIGEIDEDFVTEIHSVEDLKRVALNWYFNNVEIVENIPEHFLEICNLTKQLYDSTK